MKLVINNLEKCYDKKKVLKDITFENIYAESCYTVVRVLSVTAPIRNIVFKNVYAFDFLIIFCETENSTEIK